MRELFQLATLAKNSTKLFNQLLKADARIIYYFQLFLCACVRVRACTHTYAF